MLDVKLIDPQPGEVVYRVPPTFGRGMGAEGQAGFEYLDVEGTEAPPFPDCVSPAKMSNMISTYPSSKAELLAGCFVRAFRHYQIDPRAAIALGQQTVQTWNDDPALASELQEMLDEVIQTFGVSTVFINKVLEPVSEPEPPKSKLPWIIGGIALLGAVGVGVVIYTRKS